MNKPAVIRFDATLIERNRRTVFEIPADIIDELSGMEKLEGTMNSHPFRAQVDADDGRIFVRVNNVMLRGARVALGDSATLAILGREPAPLPPKDLQDEFNLSPEATQTWNELTELGKRDWIRWVEDAKKPETRARRVARTVEQLSHGKRRACCVDVNGFMMCRIEEDDVARTKS